MNHIDLLVTLDRHYLSPLAEMLRSYSAHHADIVTDLYVAHSSLEEEHFRSLAEQIGDDKIHIHDVRIQNTYFRDTPVLERLPEESFYRLLSFAFLPSSVKRVLYLDPDVLIRGSLWPLYSMEMQDAYVAAASHMHGLLNGINRLRLGLKQEKYFNSGVMLLNLEEIRADFTVETVLNCLEENTQRFLMGDQDLANMLFGERVLFLDERLYNLDERAFSYHKKHNHFLLSDVEKETVILHYNGKYKPWLEGYKGELDVFYPEVTKKGPAPTKVLKGQIRSILNIVRLTKQQALVVIGALFFVCLCLFSYIFFGKELIQIVSDPTQFRAWLDRFGAFDELIFILIRAAQTVIKFIPAEPLEIASGYAWGAIPGMLYCVVGNLLGTLVILVLTRKFGKKILQAFLPSKNFKTLTVFENTDKLYSLLFLLYLIPGSPKDGFTYFIGLLPIKVLPFLLITGIARIPSVLSSTLCGATLAEKRFWVSALIFLVTIVLAVLGGFLYRAIIKKKMEKKS